MSPVRNGFSTVEVMVALVLFTAGVLGAGGMMALAWRAELTGERAAVAARLAGSILDSLRASVIDGQGRCDRLQPGSESLAHGTFAAWTSRGSAAGREVVVRLAFSSLAAPVEDTVWTFVPCR